MSATTGATVAFVATLAAFVALRQLHRAPARLASVERRHAGAARLRRWSVYLAPSHIEADLALLLEEVGSGLRAGTSLAVSLREMAPATRSAAEGVHMALVRVDRGATLAEALGRWRDTAPDAPSRLAATVLAHVASLGGADPRPLEAVADALRERVGLRGELRTQAAQARASAVVLSVLPPAFLVIVGSADRDVAHVVLRTPLGWSCLAAGLLLDAAGALWMARIVGRTAP